MKLRQPIGKQFAMAKTSAKLFKVGRGFGKNESEWPRKAKIKRRKKFLAVGGACKAIFQPSGFKGITLGSQESGPFFFSFLIH